MAWGVESALFDGGGFRWIAYLACVVWPSHVLRSDGVVSARLCPGKTGQNY